MIYFHKIWDKVGTYLFVIEDTNNLVTVDYFNQFFEIDYLPEITSETVTTKLKHYFLDMAYPTKSSVMSDGFHPQNLKLKE